MNNNRLVQMVMLSFLCLVNLSAFSFASARFAAPILDSIEGTTWSDMYEDDRGVLLKCIYEFKKNGVVTETISESDGEKDSRNGTYTQNGDSINMQFSHCTITATIKDRGKSLMGDIVYKNDNTKQRFWVTKDE